MKIKLIILFWIILSTQIIAAQPGYRGKTNLISAGCKWGAGYFLGKWKSNYIPVMEFEKVISRKNSIAVFGMLANNKVTLPTYNAALAGPVSGGYAPEYPYYYETHSLNSIHYQMVGFGAEVKNFIMRRGGLAPYGLYLTYGFNSQYWFLKNNVTYQLYEYTLESKLSGNEYKTSTNNIPAVQLVNLQFSLGKKRFITNTKFIDYGINYTIRGAWSNIDLKEKMDVNYYNIDNKTAQCFILLMNKTQIWQLYIKGGILF